MLAKEVAELRVFAGKHFSREESLQEAAGYPDDAAHKSMHHTLLEGLDQAVALIDEYAQNMMHPERAKKLHRKLQSYLYRWLLEHVIVHDMKMKSHVGAMLQAARQMVPLRAA